MAITGPRTRISIFAAGAGAVRYVFPSGAFRHMRRAACGSLFMLATATQADTFRIEPSITVEETLTNNVNLDPNSTRRGDLVSQLTPAFTITEKGAHTTFAGSVGLPILLYVRTGSENNSVQPQVNLAGNWEIVDRFFFVDAVATVNQQYLSPFGPQSQSLANATANRYTAQTYRVTPSIRSETGDYRYRLRDDNIWTKGNSNLTTGAYTNDLAGTFERDPRPLGWAVDIDRSVTKFQDQQKQVLSLARARGLYQIDPQVQLSISGGYEHNDLLLENKNDPIYGLGIRWRPTERSNAEATWEHRFFGASYNVTFENRTPLSVWNVVASRNITTYPQQLASLPPGIDVATALNQIFLARIPDAAQRQTVVNQLILDRGLPSFLGSSINIYTQQVTLQESLVATAGILGARSNLFFTAYRLQQQPITGSGNPTPDLAGFVNNTQVGANVAWSHSLTPLVTLTASVEAARTVDNMGPGVNRTGAIRAGMASPLAPFTTLYGGIRYQISRSNVSFDYDEAAIFVGLSHRFH